MWEAVQLPRETDAPEETERLIQQFAEEKMREYDGAVFFCISRADKERRLTFRQAATSLGCSARGRVYCLECADFSGTSRKERPVCRPRDAVISGRVPGYLPCRIAACADLLPSQGKWPFPAYERLYGLLGGAQRGYLGLG